MSRKRRNPGSCSPVRLVPSTSEAPAESPEETYLISEALAQRLAPLQQKVSEAQAALNTAVEIALSAMGVEGRVARVEIHPDPLRFRLIREA